MRSLSCAFVTTFMIAACTAEPSQPTTDSSPAAAAEEPTELCAAYCEWRSRCGKGSTSCTASCAEDNADQIPHVRRAYWSGMRRCFGILLCDKSEDACLSDFAWGDPAYPNIEVVQACLAKRTDCGNPFADDLCRSLAALTDGARAKADECRARPCADISQCLRDAGAFTY